MERNVTLDFVRGVAILGILLLNISAFGLPKAAYLNPAWSGSATLSDAWTWAGAAMLAEGRRSASRRAGPGPAAPCCGPPV